MDLLRAVIVVYMHTCNYVVPTLILRYLSMICDNVTNFNGWFDKVLTQYLKQGQKWVCVLIIACVLIGYILTSANL